jgi:hypothetical protein
LQPPLERLIAWLYRCAVIRLKRIASFNGCPWLGSTPLSQHGLQRQIRSLRSEPNRIMLRTSNIFAIPLGRWLLAGALLVGIYCGWHAGTVSAGAGGAQAASSGIEHICDVSTGVSGLSASQSEASGLGSFLASAVLPNETQAPSIITGHNSLPRCPAYHVLKPDPIYPYYRLKTIVNQ